MNCATVKWNIILTIEIIKYLIQKGKLDDKN